MDKGGKEVAILNAASFLLTHLSIHPRKAATSWNFIGGREITV